MSLAESLQRLYRANRRQLFACALSVVRCPERAEDAVHAAFVKLFAMEREPRHLRAYVFRAVRNAAIDTVRRERSARKTDPEELGEYIFNGRHPTPAEKMQAEETNRAVARALEGLPREQRDVIVMHLYGELKFREIATALDWPQGTVVSRYRRGLRRLADALED